MSVFFWNSLAFSKIQWMLAIWTLVPLPFLKPAWTSGSSWFTYCWSLAWRILSITLLACETSAIVLPHFVLPAFFGNAFLWDWNENWPFPVHGTTDWFQIGKGVCQGFILLPCLFNLYAEYNMRNNGLDEAQAGVKISGRNIDMQMTPHLCQNVKKN